MADPNFLSNWSPRRRSRWVLYGFLLVAAFYLLLEHTAHTIPSCMAAMGMAITVPRRGRTRDRPLPPSRDEPK